MLAWSEFSPEWETFRAGACLLTAMLLELCARWGDDALTTTEVSLLCVTQTLSSAENKR